MTRRVCLITSGHLATDPRLVKEADALSGAGWKVHIIATQFATWAVDFDKDFDDKPWRIAVKIRFGPFAPLAIRMYHWCGSRLGRAAVTIGLHCPWIVERAWHEVTPRLVAAAKRVPADLYIAHLPTALPAAAAAARRHKARYAFDAEDFHCGDPPEGVDYALQRKMTGLIEARYLPGCSFVTAASPGIAKAYATTYGIAEPAVLHNVFPLDCAPKLPTAHGTAAHRPSLYWFSQTIGPNRGLECAVNAIALSHVRPHLYLRGNPAIGYCERLRAAANRAGVLDRVHILPPEPPSTMVRLAVTYDLGLAGEIGETPNRKIALTNKLFTYLLAGVPVLLSAIPAHQNIATELGIAASLYAIDDAESLADAIDFYLTSPARLAAARHAAFALGQRRFNWDRESATFLQLAEGAILAGRGDPHK